LGRAKRLAKILLINLAILIVLGAFLEILFRALYPEFRNHIYSQTMSLGKNMIFGKFHDATIRVPYAGYEKTINPHIPMILILGDSISAGYGCGYEDIYWRKFERLLNITGGHPVQVISLSGYGNNLADSAKNVEAFLSKSKEKLPVKAIIYQFNFNDITPYDRQSLKQGKHLTGIEHTDLFRKVALLRQEYLNYSVFMRVMQHYAGELKAKRHGSCESRGYEALRWYTYTFGSRPFKKESEQAWADFEASLEQVKILCDKIGAKCIIVISPLLYDIDTHKIHKYYNFLNLDFRCATINPKARLAAIAGRLHIDLIDPTPHVKEEFERLVREGNFEPFYFTAEDNHFTPVTGNYVAESMLAYFVQHHLN
jgi:hypothetical protein